MPFTQKETRATHSPFDLGRRDPTSLKDIQSMDRLKRCAMEGELSMRPCLVWSAGPPLTPDPAFFKRPATGIRMKTVGPVILRQAVQDTEIKGISIPKGCAIIINNAEMHQQPGLFSSPATFQLQRPEEVNPVVGPVAEVGV